MNALLVTYANNTVIDTIAVIVLQLLPDCIAYAEPGGPILTHPYGMHSIQDVNQYTQIQMPSIVQGTPENADADKTS